MNARDDTWKTWAGAFLALTLGLWTSSDGGTAAAADSDTPSADAEVVASAPEPQANPYVPTLGAVLVYFQLDPRLTRGRHLGDQWVTRPSFTTTRRPGRQVTLNARAVGVSERGRLMYRRLDVEWLPADPETLAVSPHTGSEVTLTMPSPGETVLHVTNGEVSETLTLQAVYDESLDVSQLTITRSGHEDARRTAGVPEPVIR